MPEPAPPTFGALAIANYLLAAVGYTLLGRMLLAFFVPPDWENYIWRFFRLVTDPVLALTRRITPAAVPDVLLPLVAFFWTLVARCTILHGAALWVVVTYPSLGTLAVWLYLLSRCIVDIVFVDLGLLVG